MDSSSFYTHAFVKGNQVFVRAVENGKPVKQRVNYRPTLFIPNNDSDSGWTSISGGKLEPKTFDGIFDAKDFLKSYEGVKGTAIFGMPRFVYTYLNQAYPKVVNFDKRYIRTVYLDIEVSSEHGFPNIEAARDPITAITAKDETGYYVYGYGDFIPDETLGPITYHKCRDEQDLLLEFLKFWEGTNHPNVVTGWNITTFDLPYLAKRLASELGAPYANRLSPWDIISDKQGYDKLGKETKYIEIAGVQNLDYLELYKKFTYSQQESYKLDHIAKVELGEQKKDYHDYQTLFSLYQENHQAFMAYNVHDVTLVFRLEEKMKLIDLALTIAYDAKVNYEDVFMQVRLWDVLIHNYLWERQVAVPAEGGGHKEEAYVGAYVKEPKIGRHRWVMNYDVNSMYPNLIRMFNISPETILNECHSGLKVDDILHFNAPPIPAKRTLAANGWLFRTDIRGFLPEMMERIGEDRNAAKKKMQAAQKRLEKAKVTGQQDELQEAELEISKWKNMQLAKKVQLNAAYGALGNPHFRHFDIRQATAITLGGQLVIRYAEQEINKFLQGFLDMPGFDFVIASDTDSLYLNMAPLVDRLVEANPKLTTSQLVDRLDKVSEQQIVPQFKTMFAKLGAYLGAAPDAMVMKRENIADYGIWTAKKRYILNVHDSEGVRYAKPKLKMMGIEAVKSSTPMHCRKAIVQAIEIIVSKTETDVQAFIADYREKFSTLPFDEIAFPRSVSNLQKYNQAEKGVPIHVKGALLYNDQIVALGLESRYDIIKEGEKIKFCYLVEPNPLRSHVISAITILPPEFKMQDYLDYNTQFEKAFLEPVQAILSVIGWKAEPVQTLEEFFS